jgi:CRP/FNR family transcriptional regulator, nitrogen oxide reductase regulator
MQVILSNSAPDAGWSAIPFFTALASHDRDRLISRARIRRLAKADSLWTMGAAAHEFMFVLRGRVKLVMPGADGQDGIINLRDSGQLVCAGAACAGTPYCCSAVAHTDHLDVAVIPKSDVLSALDQNPSACRAFLQEMASCTVTLCGRVGELNSGMVERRLARMLLRLADRIGETRPDGSIWIPVALSRQDLAELCNTVTETATRAMRRLAKAGIVETRPRGFVVRDRAMLLVIANR